MMKIAGVLALLSVTALILSACVPGAAPPAEPTTPAGGTLLPNLLVQVEGDVLLRRSGWVDFIPVGFGTVVAPGDLLRVGQGTVARVFCGADGTWEKGTNLLAADGAEHGVPCNTGRPPRPWSDVVALRGETDEQMPYVLSPRNSALLSDRPQLQWHPLQGVKSYTVTLVGDDGQTRAAQQVNAPQLDWPADWAPLQPEASYVLVVEGGGRRSDAGSQGNLGLGFWLLMEDEAKAVRAQEDRLRLADLEPPAIDLLVAELYTYYGLHAEAAHLLEALSASKDASSVWLGLGQSYLEMGLAEQAQQAFQKALAAAQQVGEREAEAAAQVGAGLASRLLNDDSAARAALEAAQSLYKQIGDEDAIAEVKLLLTK